MKYAADRRSQTLLDQRPVKAGAALKRRPRKLDHDQPFAPVSVQPPKRETLDR